ncbi:MAG: restriction endonuclease subunit S [Candidatus Kuenenia stuttgartiensis]|nr:restriction endonuclease subunit S [Candidatus Kuenenia stuttgartiensis]
MSKQTKNIPKHRFPQFANEKGWEVKKLGEACFNIASGKDKNEDNGIYNLYGSTGIIGKTNSVSYDGDFILVARVGANAGFLNRVNSKFGVTDNTLVISLANFQSVDFIYYNLENFGLNKLVFGSGQPLITGGQLKNLELFFPSSLKEQQKIASCLSSLDEVITAESQKLDVLKEHKKGLLQNLFPQEGEKVPKMRFKEFKGEWEEKKLGEVATFVNEKTPLENLSISSYISTENILPDFAGVTSASKLPTSGNFTKYRKGDVLISNIRPYLKKVWFSDKEGAGSNDVFVVRTKSDIQDFFLSFLLKNDNFINYVMVGAKGVKMPGGDKDLISKYPISFPSKTEQQKIASGLSSLDEIIQAQAEKIELLQLHKKGLLQGLFPKMND